MSGEVVCIQCKGDTEALVHVMVCEDRGRICFECDHEWIADEDYETCPDCGGPGEPLG